MMAPKSLAVLMLLAAIGLASPAGAQVGVPGNGPLTPDGPRRGLGPPSLSDNVPDLRLQGGSTAPMASPPIYGGGGYGIVPSLPQRAPRSAARRRIESYPELDDSDAAGVTGRRCRTPARICVLSSPAPVATPCSCRVARGKRARGATVR